MASPAPAQRSIPVQPAPAQPVPKPAPVPSSGGPANQGWVMSAFDGVSVKNTYTNAASNRVILYGQGEGMYDNLLVCKSGVSNIDNMCVCPGSSNSTPFNNESSALARLFVPEQPGMIPPPTHASRCLMAERRPLNLSAPYEPFLGDCDITN